MKMKRMLVIVLSAAVIMTFGSMPSFASGKYPTINIQPNDLRDYYNNIDKVIKIPKGKWVKFAIPKREKFSSHYYYYKFYPTKKAGYKYYLTLQNLKGTKSTYIEANFQDYRYADRYFTNVKVGLYKSETIKEYMANHRAHLIEIHDWEYGPSTNRILLREVPMNPTTGKIESVSADASSFTVNYKQSTYAGKYAVAYRADGGKWKYCYTRELTKTVSGLKTGQTYTVKVRGIRTVSKKNYYGKWSAGQTVTIGQEPQAESSN